MHFTRGAILPTALLWITIVQGLPSANAPPKDPLDGNRDPHDLKDYLIELFRTGTTFGAGFLFRGYLTHRHDQRHKKPPPQTSIHQKSALPGSHVNSVGDLASHFETTEDWHSAMDCIDSKVSLSSKRWITSRYEGPK